MSTSALSYRLTFAALRLVFQGYFRTHVSGRDHPPPAGVAPMTSTNYRLSSSLVDSFFTGSTSSASYRLGFDGRQVPVAASLPSTTSG